MMNNTTDYLIRRVKSNNKVFFDIEEHDLIYSDMHPIGHGMQCNFLGGTEQYDEIMKLCSEVVKLIKQIDFINKKNDSNGEGKEIH